MSSPPGWSLRANWFLYEMTVSPQLMVTVLYWVLLASPGTSNSKLYLDCPWGSDLPYCSYIGHRFLQKNHTVDLWPTDTREYLLTPVQSYLVSLD